jgi:hypothetical protein
MSLLALIRKGGLAKAATATVATLATQGGKKAETVALVATVAVANPSHEQINALTDPVAEARRRRLLELLAANPSKRYALVTDTEADPVILALGIRGQATCEFCIPRDKYDPFLLLALIERHGGAVH